MKIAFISYEYPPDTAYGGIATYVYQAVRILLHRGHQVEVFTSSPHRAGADMEDGILVHRINQPDHQHFAKLIAEVFAARHALVQFDVLEGPDYAADAREAVRLVPDIPLVLKLHTPAILLLHLNYREDSFVKNLCFYLRAFKRRMKFTWGYDPNFEVERLKALQADRVERQHALDADEIAAPSTAIAKELIPAWGLDPERVSHVPYPYIPLPKLLNIPVDTCTNVVTFIGRLELRKGVIDLARAIPLILRRHPKTKFRFVGSSEASPWRNVDMQQYLERMLQAYSPLIEFTGAVTGNRIPEILQSSDICVFPSLWENFPCVCLESMAAGRAVVGSNSGGMADMLAGEGVGRLVPPHSPEKIAAAVIELLGNPELRKSVGQAARDRLLSEYNAERIGALQEASYTRAIARRKAIGARQQTACSIK